MASRMRVVRTPASGLPPFRTRHRQRCRVRIALAATQCGSVCRLLSKSVVQQRRDLFDDLTCAGDVPAVAGNLDDLRRPAGSPNQSGAR